MKSYIKYINGYDVYFAVDKVEEGKLKLMRWLLHELVHQMPESTIHVSIMRMPRQENDK